MTRLQSILLSFVIIVLLGAACYGCDRTETTKEAKVKYCSQYNSQSLLYTCLKGKK